MFKNNKPTICFKLIKIAFSKNFETTLLNGIAAIILAVAFFFAIEPVNQNYILLFEYMSHNMWGLLFLTYGAIKLASLLYDVNYKIHILNALAGLWAWNYIFLSFTVFDTTPIAPTEYLLLLPVFVEFWILTTTKKRG